MNDLSRQCHVNITMLFKYGMQIRLMRTNIVNINKSKNHGKLQVCDQIEVKLKF